MQNIGINRQMGKDSVSKNIQNQIANAQQELQELSSNKELSIEEKMNRRQEIQQQITDLSNQLRMHQIEMRREQQQSKSSSMDDMLGSTRTVSNKAKQGVGLSQASMQAIFSADSAITQVQSSGRVVTKMEGRAGVLETEIKLDSARGNNVEAKQEELAEVQQKASQAQDSQMNVLANANKELEEAVKSDQQTKNAEDKTTITDENEVMLIGNNIEINSGYQNSTSKAGGYKNVREYSKYLMDKYSCLTPGNNVAVTVTSGMLKKAMTDEKTGKWLERIEEKKEEKRAAEKQRIENIFTGKDLKSVTDSFIQTLSTTNSSIISLFGFDAKV